MLKIILVFIIFIGSNIVHADTVTIQSTTSTRDSGLYKYLLPFYPKYKETQIKVVAVGTGQAINNARNCDGGILIVHDKKREAAFMKNNYGSKIHNKVIENNEQETGITIHYVNNEYDAGEIIFQKNICIEENDTVTTLEEKIHKLEYEYYPKVIQSLLIK